MLRLTLFLSFNAVKFMKMKNSLLLIFAASALLTGCTKKENTSEIIKTDNQISSDTVQEFPTAGSSGQETAQIHAATTDINPPIPDGPTDSVITTDEMIYSDYPADNLPMEKLSRTITNEEQVVYVKIQNAKTGQTFSVQVEHENPEGNIAVRHIYGPGMQEGPFGNTVDYKIPKDGDYTFAIKKNNRAEGRQSGNILITLTKK